MIGVPVLIFAVACAVLFALSTSSRADEPGDMAVSLVQLIANPASFDGKRVVLTGYVVLEVENTAVYLHESDATYAIARNGLWLDVPPGGESHRARFHQQYVLVEGTFNARRRGHLGRFSGTVENIGRFQVVDPRPGPLRPAPH
jgi:hypothetical protein